MNASILKVLVEKKVVEAVDICTFELVGVDQARLPAFAAGSHIDVHLPSGLTRQYSLCNDPAEDHRYLIGVLKDPAGRGGSMAMHQNVQVGSVLEISAPRNHFPLVHEAKRSLLLAGGIGVTQILCMAERLSIVGAPFDMHYCTRSEARTAFYGRIGRSTLAAHVHFHFDDGPAEQKLDLSSLLAGPQLGVHLYVCGPKGFMDAVLWQARAAAWPEAQLHYEFFSAEPMKSEADGAFQVKLASSGKIVLVPKDKTVAEALAAAGVDIETSCEQGVCGTCLTRVLEGEPEHRDLYLTPAERAANDQFLPCCSRARTPLLVLDL